MPGLVELLEKSTMDVEIFRYRLTDKDTLYLESETPEDGHSTVLEGDCYFKKQSTNEYHLVAVTTNTASNNFLPLLALLRDKGILFANEIEFVKASPYETCFQSKAKLMALLNAADCELEEELDLDNEACAPQISRPHSDTINATGLLACSMSMFAQTPKQSHEDAQTTEFTIAHGA